MSETIRLKDALKFVEEHKITEAIESLKGCTNFYNLELSGVLYSVYGDLEKSYSIFQNLKNNGYDVEKYITYFDDVIKKSYIPLFNQLIDELRGAQSRDKVEKMIKNLEKIFPNVELYNIATMFYLSQNDYKSARENYEKLKQIDDSFIDNGKYELIFNNRKSSPKKAIYVGVCILALILAFMTYKNTKLKNNLDGTDSNITKLNEDLNKSNTTIASLQNEIELLNKEIQQKDKEYNSLLAKKEPAKEIVQQIIVPSKIETGNNSDLSLLSDKEIYNLIIKRYFQNKYEDALNIIDGFNDEKLPEYQRKELVYLTGFMNDKLGNKEKALEAYKDFVAKYNKKAYKSYILKANDRIKVLQKE